MNQKIIRKNIGKKETKKVYSVTLPPALVKKLDETREFWGISRSIVVQISIKQFLNPNDNVKGKRPKPFLPPKVPTLGGYTIE